MIELTNGFFLDTYKSSDKETLITQINDPEIYKNTLNIPYPYKEAHADQWLNFCQQRLQEQSTPVTFAIRSSEGLVVGAIGLDGLTIGEDFQSELGYWLARSHWGRGLMTQATQKVCAMAFDDWGLEKVTAHVYERNTGSQRVLEKNGFQLEGKLRKHYCKDGEFLDGRIYGLIKEDCKIR